MRLRGIAAVAEMTDDVSRMHAIAGLLSDGPRSQMSICSEASRTQIFNYVIARQCSLSDLSSDLSGIRDILSYTVLDLDDSSVGDSANQVIIGVVTRVFALVTVESLAIWTKLDPIDSVPLTDFRHAIEEENCTSMRRGI